MEEKRTHELVGTVVSDVNDKTITVLVETYKNDKLYHLLKKCYSWEVNL